MLDKKTGRLVASDDERIGTRLFHGQWSSPSLGVVNGKPQIFFGGGDGVLYAFEPLTAMPKEPRAAQESSGPIDCNPPEYKVVNGRKVVYTDGDIRKHRGNNNDGTFIGPSEIIGTPVFYKNRVYVTTGQDPSHGRGVGMLTCIDATKTGDVTGWPRSGPTRSAAASPHRRSSMVCFTSPTRSRDSIALTRKRARDLVLPHGLGGLGLDDGGRRQDLPGHEEEPAGAGRGQGKEAAGQHPPRHARLLHAGCGQRSLVRGFATLFGGPCKLRLTFVPPVIRLEGTLVSCNFLSPRAHAKSAILLVSIAIHAVVLGPLVFVVSWGGFTAPQFSLRSGGGSGIPGLDDGDSVVLEGDFVPCSQATEIHIIPILATHPAAIRSELTEAQTIHAERLFASSVDTPGCPQGRAADSGTTPCPAPFAGCEDCPASRVTGRTPPAGPPQTHLNHAIVDAGELLKGSSGAQAVLSSGPGRRTRRRGIFKPAADWGEAAVRTDCRRPKLERSPALSARSLGPRH